MRQSIAALALSFLIAPSVIAQQEIKLSPHTEPVPAALAALKDQFGTGGTRATVGSVMVDFWFVKALPLSGTEDPSWSGVAEGTLVGAVRFSAPFRDIRGRTLKAGVYTLRYGVQPANGDHMGVSPYRDFLLAAPADADTNADPVGHDAAVELSKRATGISHPAPLSLDPPVAPADAQGVVTNSEGHQSVILSVPVSREGKAAGALRFGLILVGRIEA